MNTKITSLNLQLLHLQKGEVSIAEAKELFGHCWSSDAQRQLDKHKDTIKELISEYGVDGYEWMLGRSGDFL